MNSQPTVRGIKWHCKHPNSSDSYNNQTNHSQDFPRLTWLSPGWISWYLQTLRIRRRREEIGRRAQTIKYPERITVSCHGRYESLASLRLLFEYIVAESNPHCECHLSCSCSQWRGDQDQWRAEWRGSGWRDPVYSQWRQLTGRGSYLHTTHTGGRELSHVITHSNQLGEGK